MKLIIMHYGHPINNWGWQIENNKGEVVSKDMQCSQYDPSVAVLAGGIQLLILLSL